jgi:protein-disulfide isomerase
MIHRRTRATASQRLLLSLLVAACLSNGQTVTGNSAAKADGPAQSKVPLAPDHIKETVEHIARTYILDHPELLVESLRRMQENSKVAETQRTKEMLSARKTELAKDLFTPAAGNASSDVTLTFFFDYRCGYCKKVTADLIPLTQADSKVRVVFKELPILGPESETASRAALAAAKQNAYLEFHKALMGHQGAFSLEALEEIARGVKLDVAKWKADMAAPEVEQAIRANQELAASIGIQATPTFVAGSELAAGALDAKGFAALIDRAKAQAQTVASTK